MMRLTRRSFIAAAPTAIAMPRPAGAQFLRPHEPLDPRKAQSLPTSPLAIESSGKMHAFTVEDRKSTRLNSSH